MSLEAKTPIICPAILAADKENYKKQIENIASFAHRIQIDLTDGIFAGPLTVDAEDAWWPAGINADFHLMYDNPLSTIKMVTEHDPHMFIIHAEANGDFKEVANYCHSKGIKIGVALLSKTPANVLFKALQYIDHVLIFSGDLGKYGGHANLELIDKVKALKQKKPEIEVGWDGGVDAQNVSQLIFGGVDVLNVGGYIQKADDPAKAYQELQRIAEETGTT